MSGEGVVEALQSTLGREHAAVYGYGVVGANLTGSDRTKASACLAAHKQARDELEALIRSRDATPVSAHPAYSLPLTVTGARTARSLASRIERSVAGAYVGLVGASTGSVRRRAVLAMQASAKRQAHWSRSIDALPGLRT